MPLKLGDLPLDLGDLPLDSCDLPVGFCDLPVGFCDLPVNFCDLPLELCDLAHRQLVKRTGALFAFGGAVGGDTCRATICTIVQQSAGKAEVTAVTSFPSAHLILDMF